MNNSRPSRPSFRTKLLNLHHILLALLVLVFVVSAAAQVSRPPKEKPRSFALNDNSQNQVDRKILPAIDTQRLLEEDRSRERDPKNPGPHRFALAADVSFTLSNSGTWKTVPDGRIWRLRIQSAGSKNINLGITRFDLTDAVKLWIYNPDHSHVEGPYSSRDRTKRGSLWTPVIRGDEIVVELFVPSGSPEPGITITRVNRGYRGFEQDTIPGGGTSGACQIDVICPQGDPYRNQIRAVGVYTLNGSADCSGTLMNNTALDGRPYFLSANHCGVTTSSDDTVVMYWNFESPTCGTHGPGSTADNQTGGATFRAGFAPSDFVLFEMNSLPDPSYHVFYAGWDASGIAPAATVAIHHPSADVKAIAVSNTAPQSSTWTGTFPTGGVLDPSGNHWQVVWDQGGTEPGSSGACLFRSDNGRCIGQNHGGQAACATTNPTNHYGKFSVSWTGGGTDSTRLSNWLDPGASVLTMDGDPHITTANGINYDFQGAGEYVSVRDGGMEIQTRITPISTTFFPGPHPYDNIASCVSVISGVAVRVGTHRVTYEANLSGVPDPSGMQLRVDGVLTTLGSAGLDFGGGSQIRPTSAAGGLEVHFPNGHVLFITPGYWADQGKWYLTVDLDRGRAMDGGSGGASSGPSGLAGTIPAGSWLPRLPDGTPMGPMPTANQDRYNDLYQKFGGAWRITDATSLFDYAPGTSTATFTMLSWPLQNGPCIVPHEKPAQPASMEVAIQACRDVKDPNRRQNCIFDVRATGFTGFAKTYIESQNVLTGSTTPVTPVTPNPPSSVGKWAVFFDGGANFPHSPFSSFFNPGPSFNAGLEYMATPNFSVEGIFGYHRLNSIFAGADTNLFQVSSNGKFYFAPSTSSVRPFVNGGVGAYAFNPGSVKFGGNVGGGLLFVITPRFGVQGSYNFHAVNTSGSTFKFSTVQGGVRFVF